MHRSKWQSRSGIWEKSNSERRGKREERREKRDGSVPEGRDGREKGRALGETREERKEKREDPCRNNEQLHCNKVYTFPGLSRIGIFSRNESLRIEMREERKQKREDPCGNNEQLNCNCTATGFALSRVEQQRVKREERRGKRSPKKPPEIHKLIDSKVCWPQGRLESRGRPRGLRHLPFGASVGAGSSPDGGRIGSTGAAARSEGWSVPSDG